MKSIIRRFTKRNPALGDEQDAPNEDSGPAHEGSHFPERPPSHRESDINQLRTVLSEQRTPSLRLDTSRSTSKINFSEDASPAERPTDNLDDLKTLQTRIPTAFKKPATEPEPNLFKKFPSCTIILPIIDVPLKYCALLLHDQGRDEKSLKDIARRLQQKFKSCLFILLRGPRTVHHPDGHLGHCWNKSEYEDELSWSCGYLLEKIILKRLVNECHFRPRNIVILGHGQGAIVALRAVTIWNEIEFGGVIAVGSQSLFERHITTTKKARTPILLVRSGLEERHHQSAEILRGVFPFVDMSDRLAEDEDPPTGLHQMKGPGNDKSTRLEINIYIDFLVHRLLRDEWKKQDIISFGEYSTLLDCEIYRVLTTADGGGIRGYGSLLILEALMEKIEMEEASQDETVSPDKRAKSSFHPCDFKPTKARMEDHDDPKADISSPGRVDSGVEVNRFKDHPKPSARFLPCHYFTYAAGTSTGGYVSSSCVFFVANGSLASSVL